VVVTCTIWWNGLLDYVDSHYTAEDLRQPEDGYRTPVHYLRDVRDYLRQSRDVLVITDGVQILHDKEPAIWTAMLYDSASVSGRSRRA
jgi:hypothetical protein